jgi:hypothetical protein
MCGISGRFTAPGGCGIVPTTHSATAAPRINRLIRGAEMHTSPGDARFLPRSR